MCVIYACASKLPPEDELQRGAVRNDDGAGIAWLQGGKVHFHKNMKTEQDVLKYIHDKKVPFPLAIHFRTASAGGISPGLCHPFPVAQGVSLDVDGSAGEVLFHNGHLSDWESLVLRAGLAAPEAFPEGDWSDSRALAWLTYLKGPGILRFIHQQSRILLLSADPYWEPDYEGDPWVNFAFWGSWHGKAEEGWKQSTLTEYYNRGGRSFGTKAAADAYNFDADDSTPSSGIIPVGGSTKPLHSANVWTLSELTELLAEMEKELADARAAARV